MANNLRVFNTNSEYQSADLILPSVSYVVETDKVIYDYTPPTPPVFQGKWKAIYQDSHVESAQCGSSSEITQNEINLTNLVSVEIGDCVTSIGNSAFYNCRSLTSATIGSGVTNIGNSAFIACTCLTSIVIPSGVTSIGDGAFGYCEGLTSCTIGGGVTSIGNSAFENCRNLTSITCLSTTPPALSASFIFPPRQFENTNNCPIYVPAQSVSAYKAASGWKNYASRIFPIP